MTFYLAQHPEYSAASGGGGGGGSNCDVIKIVPPHLPRCATVEMNLGVWLQGSYTSSVNPLGGSMGADPFVFCWPSAGPIVPVDVTNLFEETNYKQFELSSGGV